MSITFTVDDAAIQAALHNLNRSTADLTPAMDDIGEMLVGMIQEQLKAGETPWGNKFVPLSPDYLRKRPNRVSGTPLSDTKQHLFNRINAHAGSDFVEVGILDHPRHAGTRSSSSVRQ